MGKNRQIIEVKGKEIAVVLGKKTEMVSLTDIARGFNKSEPGELIRRWLRNASVLEFLETWEILHNKEFNLLQSNQFRLEAQSNATTISIKKWVNEAKAVGIKASAGRYGGTYAHTDIAINFCYWLSPAFQLYFVKEFQRLKNIQKDWNLKRELSKLNYHLQGAAIKSRIPEKVDKKFTGIYYAREADLINVAVFNTTAAQWRENNPNRTGNLRDHAAPEELHVIANIEALNASWINEGTLSQEERLVKLRKEAIWQLSILELHRNIFEE
ncbi:MAG: KilA-N domain-containing protein [Bacteroidota bacterium]